MCMCVRTRASINITKKYFIYLHENCRWQQDLLLWRPCLSTVSMPFSYPNPSFQLSTKIYNHIYIYIYTSMQYMLIHKCVREFTWKTKKTNKNVDKPARVSSILIGCPIQSPLCHIEAKSFVNYKKKKTCTTCGNSRDPYTEIYTGKNNCIFCKPSVIDVRAHVKFKGSNVDF